MKIRKGNRGKPPMVPSWRSYRGRKTVGGATGQQVVEDRPGAPKIVGSGVSGRSTPTALGSVLVASIPLSRDLSDLSGSYYHGGHELNRSSRSIPRSIYRDDESSISSIHNNWRQAYVLSTPSPDTILSDLSYLMELRDLPPVSLQLEKNAVEIVCQPSTVTAWPAMGLAEFHAMGLAEVEGSPRIPLIVLLMDINKKSYELLRIFIDASMDNVRDVLQSIRKNIPDTWKQDYDGLLQVRSGVASQLIHCLSVQHYDVQPFECWIAKPWSMAAKIAGYHGETLIDHLKHLGALENTTCGSETIVTLSDLAGSRNYEPDGAMDHYHAMHYLCFSPPFEEVTARTRRFTDDRSVSSTGSRSSTRSKVSLDTTLQALDEDDNHTYNEESHEVQTVSSYSYLSAIDPIGVSAIAEEDEREERDIPQPETCSVRSNEEENDTIVQSSSSMELESSNSMDQEEEQAEMKPNAPRLLVKGFVGMLLRGRSNNSFSSSSRNLVSNESPLSKMSSSVTWDLTPMNSSYGTIASCPSAEESGSEYSDQPLLVCPSVVEKQTVRCRYKQLHAN